MSPWLNWGETRDQHISGLDKPISGSSQAPVIEIAGNDSLRAIDDMVMRRAARHVACEMRGCFQSDDVSALLAEQHRGVRGRQIRADFNDPNLVEGLGHCSIPQADDEVTLVQVRPQKQDRLAFALVARSEIS